MVELARRLRAANNALEAMRTLDLGGRLAHLLLDTMGGTRLVALTQREIAGRLGASREAVNRKLNDWAGLGWVSLSRFGVRVVDGSNLALLGRERRP
jgi:CRP-like cAMP-binding protein